MKELAFYHPDCKPFGLTGGMGTGKSTVAAALSLALGCLYIDADQVARQVVEPGEPGWRGLQTMLGSNYFQQDGQLDRRRVRSALFEDKELRCQVNDLLHPMIHGIVVDRCDAAKASGNRALVEVPLLYEAGWQDFFSPVIVIYASRDTCLKRLIERDTIQPDQALQAWKAQMPVSEKALKADHVINNDGSWYDTLLQIMHMSRLLLPKKT